MTRLVLSLAASLLAAPPLFAEEMDTPHRMLKPDGELDTDKCGSCHEEDMSLSRSKLQTCTLCHSISVHGGSVEHVNAPAASVARLGVSEKQPALPLAENGGIFCGTCHLFHDPAVGQEPLLPRAWEAPTGGVSGAVRAGVEKQWKVMSAQRAAPEAGAKFAAKYTRALRLPVDDGSLCRHCHGSGGK